MTYRAGERETRGTGAAAPLVRCAILTVSDRAFRGEYPDRSGPEVARILASWGWPPEVSEVIPDEEALIADRLSALADSGIDLILTAGGTGLSRRDRTPDATLRVSDRLVPGIMEAVRARTGARFPRAYLSRGVAALRDRCLVVNLPGSARGAAECLEALADLLPHAIEVIREEPGSGGAHETDQDSGEGVTPDSTGGGS
jgi:molybdopterin adenylyltransferase